MATNGQPAVQERTFVVGAMREYQQTFLQVSLDNSILKFRKDGFVLKSGRISPYFFNAGMFNTGSLRLEREESCHH